MAPEELACNHYMRVPMTTPHPEIIAILKGHPLYPVLSNNVTVPVVYVTQMWTSLTFTPGTPTDEEFFQFTLSSGDVFYFRFDLNLFRRTLNFPLEHVYPDKNDFDVIPDEQIMIDAVNALGYEGRFENVTMFKRKFLSRRWASLYMILNRCLSPSHAGMDSISSSMLKIFYGVAYHKHFDYARIIWDQLITILKKKAKYDKYIPFVRFLSIMLDYFLKTKPEIPALDDQPQFMHTPMKYLQNSVGSEIAKPAPIPNYLLVLGDRHDPAIKKYRESALATVPAQPQAPIPSEHREHGEGSSVLVTPSVDCSKSVGGNKKKKLHKRKRMLEVDSSKSFGSYKKKKLHKPKRVFEVVAEAEPEQHDDEPAPASNQVISHTLTSQSQTLTGNDDADHAYRPFHDDIHDYAPVEHAPNMERQGGIEGAFEKSREIERSESEMGQRKRDIPSQTTPKRHATTSATETHTLHQGIDIAVRSLLTLAQTQSSHSVSQQREIVSSVQGDESHSLPASPSESQIIETRGTQARPRLVSYARFSSNSRPQLIESSSLLGSTHLCDVVGASVEPSVSSDVQGSLGNPTSVTITPTSSIGHSTRLSGAPVVSTESLGGSAHSFTLDPALESHMTYLTLARVQTHQTTTMAPLHSYPSESQTTPQFPSQTTHQTYTQFRPSPTHTTNPIHSFSQSQPRPETPLTPSVSPHEAACLDFQRLSFHRLRALFHTRLLVEPNLSPYDQVILSILNLSTTVTSQTQSDSSMLASRLDQIVSHLQNIDDRLTALESCPSFPTA